MILYKEIYISIEPLVCALSNALNNEYTRNLNYICSSSDEMYGKVILIRIIIIIAAIVMFTFMTIVFIAVMIIIMYIVVVFSLYSV